MNTIPIVKMCMIFILIWTRGKNVGLEHFSFEIIPGPSIYLDVAAKLMREK